MSEENTSWWALDSNLYDCLNIPPQLSPSSKATSPHSGSRLLLRCHLIFLGATGLSMLIDPNEELKITWRFTFSYLANQEQSCLFKYNWRRMRKFQVLNLRIITTFKPLKVWITTWSFQNIWENNCLNPKIWKKIQKQNEGRRVLFLLEGF